MKKLIMAAGVVLLSMLLFVSSTKDEKSNDVQIKTIFPETGSVGTVISIYGQNFGAARGESEVYFGEMACKLYDFDYVSWSDNLIRVKVPTGAVSDKIKIELNGLTVEGPGFTLSTPVSHTYSAPMDVTIDYTLTVTDINRTVDKPLYIWVPSPVPSDNQRDVELLGKSANYVATQLNKLDLFKINSLRANENYTISKRFSFANYQLTTSIDPESVTEDYDRESEFYKYYTSPEYAVESDNEQMIALAKKIVGEETNPYKQARLIYDWVVDNMDYQYPPPNRDWRALSALRTRRGDCAVYSFLFSALCRATGIPARAIAGHVIFVNNYVSMHFWAEFYVPGYGWFPIDANYGDVQVEGFQPKEFYFGNMDNRHIGFSKGKVPFYLEGDAAVGTAGKEYNLRHLQKYHAYMQKRPKDLRFNVKRDIRRVF